MATKRPAGTQKRRGGATGSARRAQLLAIAAEMFATRGYSQTTVRDIADEAGILSGSLYHHFASKEEMLTEILREFMGGLLERFQAIVDEGDDPGKILDGLIRSSFRTIHETPHAVALYQQESSFVATIPGFEFVAKASRDVEKVWLGVLDAGRTSGVFRQDLDLSVVYRFIRDTVWASVQWYRPSGRLGQADLAEQYLELLHGGLLKR